jgi:hypothetical protein
MPTKPIEEPTAQHPKQFMTPNMRKKKRQLQEHTRLLARARSSSNSNTDDCPLPLQSPDNLPLWAPCGIDLKIVPKEVQQAALELIQPLYNQFVLNSSDPLEKSLGVTITHLLWLEILEQFDMKREYTQVNAVLNLPGNRHETIDRHLRLIDSKLRVGYFLSRIREQHKRLAPISPLPLPTPPRNLENSSISDLLPLADFSETASTNHQPMTSHPQQFPLGGPPRGKN